MCMKKETRAEKTAYRHVVSLTNLEKEFDKLEVFKKLGATIGITHLGVVEVENTPSNPSQKTHYLPLVVNIIQISGDIVGSQIQQASDGNQQLLKNVESQLLDYLSSLESEISKLQIERNNLRCLEDDIAAIKAQLKTSRPKGQILRDALSSIKRILEEAGAMLLAAKIPTC